jgi:hypothetical protein
MAKNRDAYAKAVLEHNQAWAAVAAELGPDHSNAPTDPVWDRWIAAKTELNVLDAEASALINRFNGR